jgi:hypothetical protein
MLPLNRLSEALSADDTMLVLVEVKWQTPVEFRGLLRGLVEGGGIFAGPWSRNYKSLHSGRSEHGASVDVGVVDGEVDGDNESLYGLDDDDGDNGQNYEEQENARFGNRRRRRQISRAGDVGGGRLLFSQTLSDVTFLAPEWVPIEEGRVEDDGEHQKGINMENCMDTSTTTTENLADTNDGNGNSSLQVLENEDVLLRMETGNNNETEDEAGDVNEGIYL